MAARTTATRPAARRAEDAIAGFLQLSIAGAEQLFQTLQLAPFIISAHDEASQWEQLQQAVQIKKSGVIGIGIPMGGGMLYHPEGIIEPIRFPVHEFSMVDGAIKHSLLLPDSSQETGKMLTNSVETASLVH